MVCVGAKLRLGSGALAGDVMDKLVWGVAILIETMFSIFIETLDNRCLIYLMMTHPMKSWIFLISYSVIVSGA